MSRTPKPPARAVAPFSRLSIAYQRALYAADISAAARAVALCLAWHTNTETGACYPSEATICEETGYGERAVQKAVKELEANNFIRLTRHGGTKGDKRRANEYLLNCPNMHGAAFEKPIVTPEKLLRRGKKQEAAQEAAPTEESLEDALTDLNEILGPAPESDASATAPKQADSYDNYYPQVPGAVLR